MTNAVDEGQQLAQDMANNTERYRHQEEINSLLLNSSDLVNNIREETCCIFFRAHKTS